MPFDSVAELEAYTGTVTQNDYAFVTGTDSEGNTYFDRYKADVVESTVTWAKEYRLNNSSFTAEQWAAITSGITQALVGQIGTNRDKTKTSHSAMQKVGNANVKTSSTISKANVTQNTTNSLFVDFIKPAITYRYSNTEINYNTKTLTVVFDMTDKYYKTSQTPLVLSDLQIYIDGYGLYTANTPVRTVNTKSFEIHGLSGK